MMLQMIGRIREVRKEPRHTRGGEEFEATVYVVEGIGFTQYVDKGRAFQGPDPEQGQDVTLAVSPSPWVDKSGRGRVSFVATGLVEPAASLKGVRSA